MADGVAMILNSKEIINNERKYTVSYSKIKGDISYQTAKYKSLNPESNDSIIMQDLPANAIRKLCRLSS
jgi:hypothetical protein